MVSDLLYEAFPEVERLPLDWLFDRTKLTGVDFLSIYDEGVFIGFTYLVTLNSLTYIQYLATDRKSQSKGYGSLILSSIKERYSNHQLILNIETLSKNSGNYKQRVKRESFYSRNGYKKTGILFKDRWGMYDVIVYGEKQVNQAEFHNLIQTFIGNSLFKYLEIQIISS